MKKFNPTEIFIVRNPDDNDKPIFVMHARRAEACKEEVQNYLNKQKFSDYGYIYALTIAPVKRCPFGGDTLTVYAESKHVIQIEGEIIELTYNEAYAYHRATRSVKSYMRNNASYGVERIECKLPEVIESVIRKHLNISSGVDIKTSFTADNQQLIVAGTETPFDFGRYFPAVDTVTNYLD